jgi:hypothetical protein
MRRPDFPIHHVESVRDLLVIGVASELAKFTQDELLRRYPQPLSGRAALAVQQEIVAFVIDSLTARAVEDLLTFKRRLN